VLVSSGRRPTTSSGGATHQGSRDQGPDRATAAELALRWHPPVGATSAAPAAPSPATAATAPVSLRGRTR